MNTHTEYERYNKSKEAAAKNLSKKAVHSKWQKGAIFLSIILTIFGRITKKRDCHEKHTERICLKKDKLISLILLCCFSNSFFSGVRCCNGCLTNGSCILRALLLFSFILFHHAVSMHRFLSGLSIFLLLLAATLHCSLCTASLRQNMNPKALNKKENKYVFNTMGQHFKNNQKIIILFLRGLHYVTHHKKQQIHSNALQAQQTISI